MNLPLLSLRYYWRTNLAVVAGVATAAGVLAGALLVGESTRESLRRLALDRIGSTVSVVAGSHLFREQLAASFHGACPMVVLEGLVTHQASGKRANTVAVYGVDERFWQFHGRRPPELTGRQAAVSEELAAELGAKPGDTLLLRLEKPADVPAESLFGRKEDAAPTIRLTAKAVLGPGNLGSFALRPRQGAVHAVFVDLRQLQREIAAPGKVNTMLSSRPASDTEQLLRNAYTLDDLGVRLRAFEDAGVVQLETSSGVLSDRVADAGRAAGNGMGLRVTPAFTYMATSLRVGDREVPYSLVAAVPLDEVGFAEAGADAIVLNDWTARDLGAKPGDKLTLEHMLWHSDGRLTNERAEMTVAGVTPMEGLAGDRRLAPEYPGITDAANVADWDPPFPMDLGRIRDRDEDYWDRYRTTPKAFLPLEFAQRLWRSRWGSLTTLRFEPASTRGEALDRALHSLRVRMRADLDPLANGLAVVALREQSLGASRGATDFGEYFSYFSFFLMVSALLLAGLFFRLGLEQRFSEVGLLRAVGFSPRRVMATFAGEGIALAGAGGLLGVLGAVLFAWLVVRGLGTWWVDAVGTRDLRLHLSSGPLTVGAFGGAVAALIAIIWTLRGVRNVTPKRLLAGAGESAAAGAKSSRAGLVVLTAAIGALALLAANVAGTLPAAGAFFGAGALTLIACLALFRRRLARGAGAIKGHGNGAVRRLAFRNAGNRPGRTVLSAALIAAATFLIVSVEAFRRDLSHTDLNPRSGTGGYSLMGETVRAVYHDPNSAEGRAALNLAGLDGTRFVPFRLRPGDDASCLNLYEPRNPRILGARTDFLAQGRFAFASVGEATEAEKKNPWLLLEREEVGGAIPAIADANSMMYVLHKNLGEELVITDGGVPVRLRLVASLADSVFQGEVIVGERNFLRAFPSQQGYRVFLIDVPLARQDEAVARIEHALADHGMDVVSTSQKLAAFHRVENTYLSTFQLLGGLGLLLGTIGLAAVLARNVFERRRELALLEATGYRRATIRRLILVENLLLLAVGLGSGVLAAVVAIAPAIASRGAAFSWWSLGGMLASVALTGVVATAAATRLSLRGPLYPALRAG